MREKIAQLEGERARTISERDSALAQISELPNIIESKNSFEAQVAVLQAENQSLRSLEAREGEEIKALRERNRVLESENVSLKGAAIAGSAGPDDLKQEYAQLLQRYNDAQVIIADLQANPKVDTAEIEKIQNENNQLRKQLQDANKRIKELEAMLSSQVGGEKQKIIELEREVQQLQDELSRLRGEHEQQKRQYETRIKELTDKSSSATQDLQQNYQRATNQINELESQKQQLENKIKQHADENNKLSREIQELQVSAGEAATLAAQVEQLNTEVGALRSSNQQKEQELKDSIRQRKLLHNQLEDLKGKIRVFCRIRPMNQSELKRGSTNVLTISDEFTLHAETKQGQIKPFVYDSVFGTNSTQEEVFEDTKRVVQSAVDGYNVCIFAYGQTGSGKTYTIHGFPGNPGVSPRAVTELFDILRHMPSHYQWKVSCYMVELYLDNLIDLLVPPSERGTAPHLSITNDGKGNVVIPEAVVLEAHSPEELLSYFEAGNRYRHTSSTKMNDASSRSHLIFGILIDVTNNETHQRTVGKLSLVDLAGSERVSKTDATADRLKEGRAINKSLTALGDVISALSSGESHIPYRNNKLTTLMRDSLGGNAKTLMFVNVSPADYNREETLMSLYYASRVKLITNDVSKNVETREFSKMKAEFMQVKIERDNYRKALDRSGITSERIMELIQMPSEGENFDDEKYDEV